MRIGYRIRSEDEVGYCDLTLAQISLWRNSRRSFDDVKSLAQRCRNEGIRYVIHPINFFISETRPEVRGENLSILGKLAEITDLGLIIHDETIPGIGMLCDNWESAYREGLAELEGLCPVSIENANDTPDVLWFWRRFASSITIDIGHIESAGMDSVEMIHHLPEDITAKIDYVHLHHKNGEHFGITDHWPLKEGCREIAALSALLEKKPDLKVILEIDGRSGLSQSIQLLQALIVNR